MDTEEDTLTTAVKTLKRAVARAKHAKHQLQRYPTSASCNEYHSTTKRELQKAYNDLGELLAERHLI